MERTAILNKEKNFVSCVLYLHNDGAHIRDFLNTVCGTMEEHFEKFSRIQHFFDGLSWETGFKPMVPFIPPPKGSGFSG